MSNSKKCSCGKTIVFHLTAKGKYMPCNPGLQTIFDPNTQTVHQGFTPHHITCPHADRYRKKAEKK